MWQGLHILAWRHASDAAQVPLLACAVDGTLLLAIKLLACCTAACATMAACILVLSAEALVYLHCCPHSNMNRLPSRLSVLLDICVHLVIMETGWCDCVAWPAHVASLTKGLPEACGQDEYCRCGRRTPWHTGCIILQVKAHTASWSWL